METLHWPRRSQFRDPQRDLRFSGPGTFEVPEEAADEYRSRGWQDPPEEAQDESESEADTEEEDPEETQDESESEVDSEEEDPEEADSEEFDAAGFVDDSWQAVTSAIEAGEVDAHLAEVREAEESGNGDPRSSVIEAIEEREDQVQG